MNGPHEMPGLRLKFTRITRFFASRLAFALLLGVALTAAGAGFTIAHAANAKSTTSAPHPLQTSITGSASGALITVNNYGIYDPRINNTPVAINGYAARGTGIIGKTNAPGCGDQGCPAENGIEGIDIAPADEVNQNNGVLGVTNNGAFGVDAEGGTGATGGLMASGNNAIWAFGVRAGIWVEAGQSAIEAVSDLDDHTISEPPAGIYSYGSFDGVDKSKTFWDSGVLSVYTDRNNSGGKVPASLIHTEDSYNGVRLMDMAQNGNLYLHGNVVSGASPETVVLTASGARLLTYAPRSASPTMEDTGEGQLVRGMAYVRIDPALSAALDSSQPYSVLITPEGDTRGVFVSQKSTAGFLVREVYGGTSTLGFAYRIVGRATGEIARPRLADLRADRSYALFSTPGARHVLPATLRAERDRQLRRLKARWH